LLHGTKYLDRAATTRPGPLHAAAILTLFRSAEVCLQNIDVLARRIVDDIGAGDLGQAAVKVSWINHFQTTLYSLSQMLVQIDSGGCEGAFISIRDSQTHRTYKRSMARLHDALREHCPEGTSDIAQKDIDDPQRFVFFNAYVNENYELMWESIFESVRLPGLVLEAEESAAAAYERMVQPGEIAEAIHSVDLREVTYLMQFRAYHQISEVLVKFVNETLCDAVVRIMCQPGAGHEHAAEALAMCVRLLSIVTDNIKPIVRTLSPKAYFAIRPALGTTSGSHSHNLRKGLFLTVYPALVKAVRLWLADFDEALALQDAWVRTRAQEVLRQDRHGFAAKIVLNTVYIHQAVRVWRDSHIQFVKTQLGVSPEDQSPTASISGSENAALTADRFRAVHATDAIAPLYAAVLGRLPPSPLPLVTRGGFDEYMAHVTADAVKLMYADVQARAQRKRAHE
jgi:tryptophan 2,3-dioxygenase